LDGETFLDRLIGAFRPHCEPLLAVLGHEAEMVRQGVQRADQVRFVFNPAPESGQITSLQCGLREVPEDAAGVIFTPVDYPAVMSSTVVAVVEAFRAGGVAVVVPTFEGRHGHPVCIGRSLIPDLLQLPENSSAREVIHRNVGRTRYIEVADAGILRDVDTPEGYSRLLERDAG
jgi:molybdenum cofactor cytidylyltransferase